MYMWYILELHKKEKYKNKNMDKTIDIKDVDYYPFIKVILKALAGYHRN